jgi:hypothetical protein
MLDSYNTCPYRQKAGEQMGRTKKIIDEEITSPIEEEASSLPIEDTTPKIKTPKPKSKIAIFKVISKTDKKFAVDFFGYGISYQDNTINKTDQVEIIYVGEINSLSFKIESYKFI